MGHHPNVNDRKVAIYHLQIGPDQIALAVEYCGAGETRVGVTVGLHPTENSLDSSELAVSLFGDSEFNPLAIPGEGPLPEVRTKGSRGAIGVFRFEAVNSPAKPRGIELRLRSKVLRFSLPSKSGKHEELAASLPSGVAKLLSETKRRAR
jgi:hypothetical protein